MFPANVVTLEKPGVPAPDAASPVALPSAEPHLNLSFAGAEPATSAHPSNTHRVAGIQL
jgi:hypothetical protein